MKCLLWGKDLLSCASVCKLYSSIVDEKTYDTYDKLRYLYHFYFHTMKNFIGNLFMQFHFITGAVLPTGMGIRYMILI